MIAHTHGGPCTFHPSPKPTFRSVRTIDRRAKRPSMVFMDFILSPNRRSLTITSPPNNRIYPPGPAYIFVTVGDTTSAGAHLMVGSGANPPVPDQ
ncbi:hypothetical protein DFH08DRAFT_1074815, partial [Mycena albidolilacea]